VSASHKFEIDLRWTGHSGSGTADYRAYSRNHVFSAPGRPEVAGSSAPVFRGDPSRYNPEDLLVASLSGCHMLWYLHLCAVNGIVVEEYSDHATGEMTTGADGGGRFTSVTLHPRVRISSGDPEKARKLHHEAHRLCFIANSVNFPVSCEPEIAV
jgi:organic hydroperoxide reductase OsmC/OhrA